MQVFPVRNLEWEVLERGIKNNASYILYTHTYLEIKTHSWQWEDQKDTVSFHLYLNKSHFSHN